MLPEDLENGDQITRRMIMPHYLDFLGWKHHGIVVIKEGVVSVVNIGEEVHSANVLDEKKNSSVIEQTLDDFMNGETIMYRVVRKYQKVLSRKQTADLALAHKGLLKNRYNLALCNCEHFAEYCKTGMNRSWQSTSFVVRIALVFGLIFIANDIMKNGFVLGGFKN